MNSKLTRHQDTSSFLQKLQQAPQLKRPRAKARIIFALDATASRKPVWDMAMKIQAEMLEEAAGGSTTGLSDAYEVQLVFYRGIAECKASGFLTSADRLVSLMSKVQCQAGATQINRVLRHASKEVEKHKVHALIFIGDACEEAIDPLIGEAGRLALTGTRAFMFQEGQNQHAAECFQEIARVTKGAYLQFDAGAQDRLRSLLKSVVVYATQGAGGLKNLKTSIANDLLRQLK